MNMTTHNDLKVQPRDRVEASVAKSLKDHGFSTALAEKIAPLAYDEFERVSRFAPANAGVLNAFLAKDKSGQAFLAEVKAYLKSLADAERALLAAHAVETAEPPETMTARDWVDTVVVFRPQKISDEVTRQLHERAEEAYQTYLASHDNRDMRDARAIDDVLAEIVEACKVAGVTDFPLPYEDRTPMSRIYVLRYKAGVELKGYSRHFRLVFLPATEKRVVNERVYNAARS